MGVHRVYLWLFILVVSFQVESECNVGYFAGKYPEVKDYTISRGYTPLFAVVRKADNFCPEMHFEYTGEVGREIDCDCYYDFLSKKYSTLHSDYYIVNIGHPSGCVSNVISDCWEFGDYTIYTDNKGDIVSYSYVDLLDPDKSYNPDGLDCDDPSNCFDKLFVQNIDGAQQWYELGVVGGVTLDGTCADNGYDSDGLPAGLIDKLQDKMISDGNIPDDDTLNNDTLDDINVDDTKYYDDNPNQIDNTPHLVSINEELVRIERNTKKIAENTDWSGIDVSPLKKIPNADISKVTTQDIDDSEPQNYYDNQGALIQSENDKYGEDVSNRLNGIYGLVEGQQSKIADIAGKFDFSLDYSDMDCQDAWFSFTLPWNMGDVYFPFCEFDIDKYTRPLFLLIVTWILIILWRKALYNILGSL